MYQIISLVIAVLGLVLFFAPDYLIKKDSENLKMVRDYHQFAGVALVGCAYYMYSSVTKDTMETSSLPSTESTSETPELPSYEKATSE